MTSRHPESLTDGDLRIVTIRTGVYRVNCYVIIHEPTKAALIFDPGSDDHELVARLENLRVRPEMVLLTHGHFDHLGAVDAVCRHYGLVCLAPEGDKRLIRQAPLYSFAILRQAVPTPVHLDYFQGAPAFVWAGGALETIPCPGHTKGTVLYRMGRFVLTGDTLLYRHIGPARPPEGDAETLKRSITEMLAGVADDEVLLPGHGRPWAADEAKAWWRANAATAPALDVFDPERRDLNEGAISGEQN